MGLTKDYSLAIIPQFINLSVVSEEKNKNKCIISSFRPIDYILFFKLEDVLFHYYPFSLNVGAMDY